MKDLIELISDLLERYLEPYGLEWIANDLIIVLTLFGISVIILTYLIKFYLWIRSYRSQIKSIKTVDLIHKKTIHKATNNYIQQRFSSLKNNTYINKKSLINYFTKEIFKGKDEIKYFLVMGESGSGKTTFLINLILKFNESTTLFGFLPKSGYIRYYPLSLNEYKNYIEQLSIDEQSRTILLLDAFDESIDAVNNGITYLNHIIENTKYFKHVIITCRTQFFSKSSEIPSHSSIPSTSFDKGVYQIQQLFISPLNSIEIENYIKKTIPFYKIEQRSKAFKAVRQAHSLFNSPMILTKITDILENIDSTYEFSIFQIYKTIVNSWIRRECNIKGSDAQKYELNFNMFCKQLANTIYAKHMSKEIADFSLPRYDVQEIADQNALNINEFKFSSRSLLTRNIEDKFEFSHKSILEYFLAISLIQKELNLSDFGFKQYQFTIDLFKSFYTEEINKILINSPFGTISQIRDKEKIMIISGYGYGIFTNFIDELHPEAVLALGINDTIESCKEISNLSRNLTELADNDPKRFKLEKQKNRLIKFNHLINKINNNA